jgi:hypothetical protein
VQWRIEFEVKVEVKVEAEGEEEAEVAAQTSVSICPSVVHFSNSRHLRNLWVARLRRTWRPVAGLDDRDAEGAANGLADNAAARD